MWTVCVPGWAAAVVAGALLLYGSLDVAYFARMMYTVAKARYFKKKVCIMDTTEVAGWCLMNDIDTLLYHMNNARYLRELDFARADFYERTGLYNNIKAAGGAVVQAAATIRYRRFLKPFTKFTITSKAIYWDDKTVFMEHEFVGPGGFVHAVAVCRQRVIDTSAAAIAELLLQLHCGGTCKHPPEKMPPETKMWTVCVPGLVVTVLAGALLLYFTLDIAYFARMLYIFVTARYFKKKVCIMDTTEVAGWCLINDIDILLYHMNNARYLRELDFARADFYERTGLYNNIKAAGGAVVQAAATIRYRRYLKPFTKFTITSKTIYWDEKTVFMEHEFVGPGGFVNAIAICRQRIIDTSAAAIAELLLQQHCGGTCKHPPERMPPELELWVQCNELSSARLRAATAPLPSLEGNQNLAFGEMLPASVV